VIIQQAAAHQIAPVVMSAYGLTEQEQKISGPVFHGLSTQAISEKLHITEHTVQDHLKSIFEKTGVRSRRELMAAVLRQQYLPRAQAGQLPDLSGQFSNHANAETRNSLPRSRGTPR
jgi:DNA-binding CsgD family transcriptional regulator